MLLIRLTAFTILLAAFGSGCQPTGPESSSASNDLSTLPKPGWQHLPGSLKPYRLVTCTRGVNTQAREAATIDYRAHGGRVTLDLRLEPAPTRQAPSPFTWSLSGQQVSFISAEIQAAVLQKAILTTTMATSAAVLELEPGTELLLFRPGDTFHGEKTRLALRSVEATETKLTFSSNQSGTFTLDQVRCTLSNIADFRRQNSRPASLR